MSEALAIKPKDVIIHLSEMDKMESQPLAAKIDSAAQESVNVSGLPATESAVATNAKASLLERFANRVSSVRTVGRKAVASTLIGLSLGGPAASVAASSERSNEEPTARAASMRWTQLGGDSLRADTDTRPELAKLISSKKGSYAMARMGMTKKERAAAKKTVNSDNFKKCRVTVGEKFKAMSYGNPVRVHKNVVFADNRYKGKGAEAWCVDVKVNTGKGKDVRNKTIKMEIPFKCGNIAIKSINITKPKSPKSPTKKPSKPITEQPKQPTVIVNVNNENHNTNQNTNNNTNNTTPTPPPAPERRTNYSPSGEIELPEHAYPKGIVKLCVKNLFDPEGNTIFTRNYQMTDSSGKPVGRILSNQPYSESSTKQCVKAEAPETPGEVTVSADILDKFNSNDEADDAVDMTVQDNYPVFPDDFGSAK